MQQYNAAIPGLVTMLAGQGKHVIFVDSYAQFAKNANYATALMGDDLHPNTAGYALLGQTWYQAIGPYLR